MKTLSIDTPLVGFLSPPDWYDPSPLEMVNLTARAIRTQQYTLALPGFDWTLESIAQTESEQIRGAKALASAGCDLIALVGTPFGWAGLDSVQQAIAHSDRLADEAGIPVVTTGVAIIEALRWLQVNRVGLACTYYDNDWKRQWGNFVTASGFKVSTHNFSDDGWMPANGKANAEFWNPAAERIRESVSNLCERFADLETIAISGAGSRTLNLVADLHKEFGIPIIGSDTALYWKIGRALNLPLTAGCLSVTSH